MRIFDIGETVTDASMISNNVTAANNSVAATTTSVSGERSRRGKHLQVGHLSDDEGSYQALSVVFEDNSNSLCEK